MPDSVRGGDQEARGAFIAQASGEGAVAVVAERLVIELGALDDRLAARLQEYLLTAAGDLTQNVIVRSDGNIERSDSQLILVSDVQLRAALADYLSRNGFGPFQAPATTPNFTGRRAALDALWSFVPADREASGVVGVYGMGGVGKSALVTFFAHAARARFRHGVLWADLRAQTVASILDHFARTYGHDLRSTRDVLAKAALVRSIISDKNALIVLDNAEHCSELELCLPSGGPSLTLVTSRDRYMPAMCDRPGIHLDVFTEGEAVEHFRSVIGRDRFEAERADACLIFNYTGRLPLATDIAARLVRRTGVDLHDVTALLASEQRRLPALSERGRSLTACFNITWERLDHRQRELYTSLAVFDGPTFSAEAVAHVVDVEEVDTRLALGEFSALSIVGVTVQRRYYLHPLLRDFAQEKLALNTTIELLRHRRALEYYAAVATADERDHTEGGSDYDVIRVELANIVGAARWSATKEAVSDIVSLAVGTSPFLFQQGYWDDCQEILDLGIRVSLTFEDWNRHFDLRLRLGELARERADYELASDQLGECLTYYTNSEDRRRLARTTRELGELRRVQRDYAEAVRLHEQCLAIQRELGDAPGEAQSLHDLALVERIIGNFAKAAACREESRRIFAEVGDRWPLSYAFLEEGIAARLCGRDDAESYLRESLTEFVALGDKRGQAYAHRELGELDVTRTRFADAAEHHERSLQLRVDLGDSRGQAISYHRLGYLQQRMGNSRAAREHYERSVALAEKREDRLHIALNHTRLGELAESDGDVTSARRYWTNALALFHEIGVADSEVEIARRGLDRTAPSTPGQAAPTPSQIER